MTDFDLLQQQLIERRLRERSEQAKFQAPQGQMVGRHYVAPNALQYLAAGLRSIGGMRGQDIAEQELKQLGQQRSEGNQKALAEFLRQSQGTPENAPADGMGPVIPAQAPKNLQGAYSALLQAPDQALRQAGTQAMIKTAQEQAQKAQQDAENRRMMGILQSARTPQEAIAAGVPAEVVKSFYESSNYGKIKVGRVVDVTGPNGEKLAQQLDEFGAPVGQPMPAYMAPVQVNRGSKIEFVSPVAGQSFDVGMSPSERDASARGWATVGQGERRLAIEGSGANRAPAGYRFKEDGTLEAIPGGPAANKDGQKPLTESQAKGSLYLGQMRSATAELGKLPSANPVSTAAAGNTFTNWATPANAQKVAQLQNQWAEAYLRAKTGAAATQGEVDLNKRTFFPVVGDSAAVIQQKAKMREQVERDMMPVAGPGAATAGGASGTPKRLRFDAQGNVIQ